MTPRLLTALAAALALAPAVAAPAKELSKAELCGADRCVDITRDAAGERLETGLLGGAITPPPSEPGRFVKVNFTFDEGEGVPGFGFTGLFVLSGAAMRHESGEWIRMSASERAWMRKVARAVEPFGADKLNAIAPEIEDPSLARTAAMRPSGPGLQGPPGPMDLTTPGAEERAAAGGDGGPGTLLIAALVAGALAALAFALTRLASRRHGAAPQP